MARSAEPDERRSREPHAERSEPQAGLKTRPYLLMMRARRQT